MTDTIKIVVKNDADEAGVAEEKLKLKGYQTNVSVTKNVVLDGTDLGGHLDFLTDPDGEVFIITGTK